MKCISSDPFIKDIKIKKSIEKFGTKTPSESQIVKDKIIKTNQERYGSNSSLGNKDIKEKAKNTLMKNYGVDNPSKSKEIQGKRISNFDTVKWRNKFEITMLERHGVKNALQSEKIKDKVKLTNNERYGVDNTLKMIDIRSNILSGKVSKIKLDKINNKYGIDNIMDIDFYKNKSRYNRRLKEKNKNSNILDIDLINNQYFMKCYCENEHYYNIDYSLYKSRKQFTYKYCTICFDPNKNNISGMEIYLYDFINENYNGEIIQNTKSIINPYELDIYLPELNLAFEFNGVHWHNELYKPTNYHKMKSDLCEDKGIQLIHIWEDDWNNKRDIIKSMILNKLNKTETKIYARKTEVKELTDNKLVREFLYTNHIQGFVGSSVKLGLFFNNELVSLMTFGGMRKSMNSKSSTENQYEMLRFCNKLNTNVIGGASKLFKYFLENYNPEHITTYADRSYSNGGLYKQLGFEFNYITEPNYYYVVNDVRKYRFGFRKDILIKEGYDANKSEHEIMLERKIYRIYNAGNYKFTYQIKNPLKN